MAYIVTATAVDRNTPAVINLPAVTNVLAATDMFAIFSRPGNPAPDACSILPVLRMDTHSSFMRLEDEVAVTFASYSYGIYSYGQYSYGLYSYGLYSNVITI